MGGEVRRSIVGRSRRKRKAEESGLLVGSLHFLVAPSQQHLAALQLAQFATTYPIKERKEGRKKERKEGWMDGRRKGVCTVGRALSDGWRRRGHRARDARLIQKARVNRSANRYEKAQKMRKEKDKEK